MLVILLLESFSEDKNDWQSYKKSLFFIKRGKIPVVFSHAFSHKLFTSSSHSNLYQCFKNPWLLFSYFDHIWLCQSVDSSMPGPPVLHCLLEFAQIHVHWVGDAIQPSHPLSSPFPPAFNLSQHQGLSQWVSSSNQVAKVLEYQPQHQQHHSFQWILSVDFL